MDTLDSASTQSTQSLSDSEDDTLSWNPEKNEEQQPQPQPQQEEDTSASIVRRNVKVGTILANTKETTDTNNRVRRVRFEKNTKFSDPP